MVAYMCVVENTAFTDRYHERASQVKSNAKHELPGLLVSGDIIAINTSFRITQLDPISFSDDSVAPPSSRCSLFVAR